LATPAEPDLLSQCKQVMRTTNSHLVHPGFIPFPTE
jgi:hypothetical protein